MMRNRTLVLLGALYRGRALHGDRRRPGAVRHALVPQRPRIRTRPSRPPPKPRALRKLRAQRGPSRLPGVTPISAATG